MIFQVSSTLLEACVLSILKKEDAYGYSLTQSIKEVVEVSETTLYPVLRRLQKESLLEVYDQPYGGRNRRYYRISDAGILKLEEYYVEWEIFKSKLDKVLTRREP